MVTEQSLKVLSRCLSGETVQAIFTKQADFMNRSLYPIELQHPFRETKFWPAYLNEWEMFSMGKCRSAKAEVGLLPSEPTISWVTTDRSTNMIKLPQMGSCVWCKTSQTPLNDEGSSHLTTISSLLPLYGLDSATNCIGVFLFFPAYKQGQARFLTSCTACILHNMWLLSAQKIPPGHRTFHPTSHQHNHSNWGNCSYFMVTMWFLDSD